MSDFSTPPWEEKKPELCPECGGLIIDSYCVDCGMEEPDHQQMDIEYLREHYD